MTDQADNERAQWKAIDELKNTDALQSERMARVEQRLDTHERDARESAAQLTAINTKLDMINGSLSEARGGLRMGKWISGVVIGLSGAMVGLWLWMKGTGS